MAKTKFNIDVERPKDITDINNLIRGEISKLKSFDPIKKRVAESRYIIALSHTENWRKDMRGYIIEVRRRAKKEYCKTVIAANKRLKELNIYHLLFSKICRI